MKEVVLHVLMIWSLLSIFLILLYDKFIVVRRMEHNMYAGKGRSYDKKKARATYITFIIVSGALAMLVVYLLSLFS